MPTLLVGGWHDIFLAQTLEQYRTLRSRGVPTRLLVGPWTHEQAVIKAGTVTAERTSHQSPGRRRITEYAAQVSGT